MTLPLPDTRPSARSRAAKAWNGVLVLDPSTTADEVLGQFGLMGFRFRVEQGRLFTACPRCVGRAEAATISDYHDALVALLSVEGQA